ncbi:hypothetical protein FEM48_Zijuj05G0174000 [Ziziphus jujuba var. spinosa]|uniref:Uncharacterized protein n=1 Tax=Ziziphus jujuba var. spinosa TaxID=714518 RepID=A0A978VG51_ZIZJJ|nr:hypothetical protein FEM48_Zijuj05G0174000 [Ziziphus jujuba var. spinosa]
MIEGVMLKLPEQRTVHLNARSLKKNEKTSTSYLQCLVEIHEFVGFLTKLVTLDFYCCRKLRTFPRNLASKNVTCIDFVELPSSIEHIVVLESLYLKNCKELVHIPASIYKLVFLDYLHLEGCTNFSKFSDYVKDIHGSFHLTSSTKLKEMAAVVICLSKPPPSKEIMEFSFELLDESDSHVGSFRRGNIVIEPGSTCLIYLPARTILSECLPYSPSNDSKITVLEKINNVSKIRVSFLNRYYHDDGLCVCGIDWLWDQDEIMIEQKLIKVADSISHVIDRSFDDFS